MKLNMGNRTDFEDFGDDFIRYSSYYRFFLLSLFFLLSYYSSIDSHPVKIITLHLPLIEFWDINRNRIGGIFISFEFF